MIRVQMIQRYISVLKIYDILYNTPLKIYMGNVGWMRKTLMECFKCEWVTVHIYSLYIYTVIYIYKRNFHAHVLVYKLVCKMLLRSSHWAVVTSLNSRWCSLRRFSPSVYRHCEDEVIHSEEDLFYVSANLGSFFK